MQPTTLRFLIFFLSASKCNKENTWRYALMTENTPNCAFKIMYSYKWNVSACWKAEMSIEKTIMGWMQRQG